MINSFKLQIFKLSIIIISLCFTQSTINAAAKFAAGGLSMGLSIGYSPDVFFLSDRGEAIAEQNLKIKNRMYEINKAYSSAAYGEKNVIRDYKAGSNAVGAVPVEVNFKYSWYGILIRMGFVFYNTPVDSRSYVLTTGSATTKLSSGTQSLYQDMNDLHDNDLSNDESLAIGLRPTYGQPVRFSQNLKLNRFEIPITFGISMFDLGPASFFFGGGMTLYWANKTRVIHAEAETGELLNKQFYQDDVDKFSASSLGFHIMLGGEYRIVKDVGLTVDLTLNFGGTGPITDSVRTGAFTNNSLFHNNYGKDYGGNERPEEIQVENAVSTADRVQIGKGLERTDSFSFSGLKLMFGVNYHIARNPE